MGFCVVEILVLGSLGSKSRNTLRSKMTLCDTRAISETMVVFKKQYISISTTLCTQMTFKATEGRLENLRCTTSY